MSFFSSGGFSAADRAELASLIQTNAAILAKLDAVLAALKTLSAQEAKMSKALDDLTASVARNTTVTGSALALIQGFAAQLAAAGTDPAKLAALQKSLDDSDQALADAVAANTTPVTS